MKRFVSYLYTIHNNQKIHNAGFARIELRTGRNRIDIHMRENGYSGKTGIVYLFVRNGDNIQGISIGNIVFRNNQADFRYEQPEENIGQTPWQIMQMNGILVFIDDIAVFLSQWDEQPVDTSKFAVWNSDHISKSEDKAGGGSEKPIDEIHSQLHQEAGQSEQTGGQGVPVSDTNQNEVPLQSTNQEGIPLQDMSRNEVPLQNQNQAEAEAKNISRNKAALQSDNQDGAELHNQNNVSDQTINQNGISPQNINQTGMAVTNANQNEVLLQNSRQNGIPVQNMNQDEASLQNINQTGIPVRNASQTGMAVKNASQNEAALQTGMPLQNTKQDEGLLQDVNQTGVPLQNANEAAEASYNASQTGMAIQNANQNEVLLQNAGQSGIPLKGVNHNEESLQNAGQAEGSSQNTGQNGMVPQNPNQPEGSLQGINQNGIPIQNAGQTGMAIQNTEQNEAALQNTNQTVAIQNTEQDEAALQNTNQTGMAIQNTNQNERLLHNVNQNGVPLHNVNRTRMVSHNANRNGMPLQNMNQNKIPAQIINQNGIPQRNMNQMPFLNMRSNRQPAGNLHRAPGQASAGNTADQRSMHYGQRNINAAAQNASVSGYNNIENEKGNTAGQDNSWYINAETDKEYVLRQAESETEAVREKSSEQVNGYLNEQRSGIQTAELRPQPENQWMQTWRHMLRTYPVLNQFQDKSVLGVRIEIKDVRMLPEKYWSIINNSFLLHGFFNYRYLAFGRIGQKWFIGVPGIYQNQEHVMASVFGFPDFLARIEKTGQGEQPGYWYRILEI